MKREPKKRAARPGPKPKYPWSTWLGKRGKVVTFMRGRDFACQPYAFAVQARTAAARLNIAVSVRVNEDLVTIENKGPTK